MAAQYNLDLYANDINGLLNGLWGANGVVKISNHTVSTAFLTVIGSSPPTTSTVGEVGSFYVYQHGNDYMIYVCTVASASAYTWVLAGGITAAERSAWNAKYDKPASGIPKSDLASAVQTSLDKADAASLSGCVFSDPNNDGNIIISRPT